MKKLSDDEAEEKVVALLREKGPMGSLEIDSHFRDRNERCPDSLVAFLARLRALGKIKGEVSRERRGWIWWVDDR